MCDNIPVTDSVNEGPTGAAGSPINFGGLAEPGHRTGCFHRG